jgi:hypothetical protein
LESFRIPDKLIATTLASVPDEGQLGVRKYGPAHQFQGFFVDEATRQDAESKSMGVII